MPATEQLVVDRVAVTVPLNAPDGVDIDGMIGVFHGWIQRGAVPGTLIDVADYRHVHHGPVVMLVAHELDYAIDLADGDLGLRVTRKRTAGPADLRAAVGWCAAHALRAITAFADEQPPNGSLSARTDELRVRVLDRRAVPSTAAGAERALAELGESADELFGASGGSVTADWAPPAPVTVRIRAEDPLSPGDLLAAADSASAGLSSD